MRSPLPSLATVGLLAFLGGCGASPDGSTPRADAPCRGDEARDVACVCTPDLAATPRCEADPAAWSWDLPRGVPMPVVPADNPQTEATFQLGRHLFYDPILSGNQTQSCASCHLQDLAFTDGLARAVGSTGEVHPRGSMSLANMAWTPRLTWANPLLDSLERQAMLPIFGEEPIVELGMAGREVELLERLRTHDTYPDLFARAFPEDDDPITVWSLVRALAAFQRGLVSWDSPWDRYLRGEGALTEAQQAGAELFFSERLECFHCHGGSNFTDTVLHTGLVEAEVAFHNTGLYNLDGEGAYPPENPGVLEITGRASDMGRFRAPTLRNIAVTAPYFHDGSAATLDDVIDHYAAGGRRIDEGPFAGDGSLSPLKSEFLVGFVLTDDEREHLKAFLDALTDETFLTSPRFADPFAE